MINILELLDWISNRLLYKYRESEEAEIFQKIQTIKNYIIDRSEISLDINKEQLDTILVKYYADFYLDSSDYVQIGYTEDQRNGIRNSVLSMAKEILDCSLNNEKSVAINS